MFARTERLLLRPGWPEDAEAIHAAIEDEGIIRNLAQAPWPYTIDDAREFASRPQDSRMPNFFLWKRTETAPQLVGCCGLGEHDDLVEIGYWIARPYWGLGYATEAARAVIDIARSLGHQRLVAGHFTDNPASGAVLQKLGFQHTGSIEPRYSRGRGHAAPCVMMQLTLDEDSDSEPRGVMLPYDAELKAA